MKDRGAVTEGLQSKEVKKAGISILREKDNCTDRKFVFFYVFSLEDMFGINQALRSLHKLDLRHTSQHFIPTEADECRGNVQ